MVGRLKMATKLKMASKSSALAKIRRVVANADNDKLTSRTSLLKPAAAARQFSISWEYSRSLCRRRYIAWVCNWEMRDSVYPMIWPISFMVSSS